MEFRLEICGKIFKFLGLSLVKKKFVLTEVKFIQVLVLNYIFKTSQFVILIGETSVCRRDFPR